MTGNYFGSMKLGKQLAEKAKEVAQEREEAESSIAELERHMHLASQLGITGADQSDGLNRARELFEAREYRECIAAAVKSTESLKGEISEMFTSRMSSTSGMMHFLSERGSDTGQLESELEQVKSLLGEEKFGEAESALTSIWQKEEKTLAEMFSHEFSAVQKAMMEAKLYCGEIEGVDKVLTDARNEITANNVESAFRLLQQAGALITREMKIKADEGVKKLSQKLEIARLFGLGINSYKDKLEQLKTIPPEEKFGEIQQLMDSIGVEVDRRLRRAFEIRLKTLRNDVHDRTFPPSFTSSSSSSLREVESQLQRSEYEAAYNGLTSLESLIERAKYDYIARILFNGKKYITMALKSGMDLAPVNRHLNDVRELMKKRRYHEAIAAAEEANREAMRLSTLTTDAEDAIRKLETEFQALVSLVSNSVDISIRYAEAKRKYDSKEIEGFLSDSNLLLKDIDTLLENFATGQIDALDRSIGALEYLGAETLEFNRRLGSALSFVKNMEFAESLKVTSSLEKEVDARLKDLNQAWIMKARTAVSASSGLLKERLEGMMDTVTLLETKGESYRSSSVAKDIVDWAANGNVFRVRSLIQRAKRLLDVVPDVTSSSAVNMLDAAERNAEIDTESALSTAGEAHDILYGLLNDYFVKEMASLMDMVSTCRRKRVEIGYGYTLIGRARAALKFEDFESAAKMVSVAREEIQHRLKQVESIESDLLKADKLLAEARKGKIDISEIQRLLISAKASLKRYDYVQAKKEISQSLMLEEKSMAANLAAKEIVGTKAILAVAAEMGIMDTSLESRKDEVLRLMRERNHYEALQAARSLAKDASQSLRGALNDMVNSIAADSAKAEIDGLDTNVVESRIERARQFLSTMEFDQCLNSLKLARDELGLVRNSVNEAIANIEKADALVIKLDELNLLESGTLNLLKQSKNLLKNDQHLLALQTAQKCVEACAERLRAKGPQLLEGYTQSMYASAGSEELDDVSEQVNRATASMTRDVSEAASSLIMLKNMAERLALQEEMARRTHEVLEQRASALMDGGVVSSALNDEIAAIGRLLDSKSYRSVIEKGIEVEQLMEELSKSSEKAKQKMSQLEDKLARYEEMGLSVDECKSIAGDALELISSGKIPEGTARIQECDTVAEKILHQACISRVAAVESAGKVAERLGLLDGGAQLPNFDELIVSGDLSAALTLSSRKLEELGPLVTGGLRSRLETSMNVEGLSRQFTDGLRKEFDDLIEGGRFEEALDFVSRTEESIASKSALLVEVSSLSRNYSELADALRKTGINTRSFDFRFRSATSDVSDKSVSELRTLLAEMTKVKSDYSPRLSVEGQKSQWGPQLKISNNGRAVALDASISVKGASVNKTERLGSLKPGESRTINLPATSRGEVLVTSAAKNPIDESEISNVRNFMLEDNAITRIVACSVCRGRLRDGIKRYECTCGRAYHDQCARRASRCECGLQISL